MNTNSNDEIDVIDLIKKSSPKRTQLIMIFGFIGFILPSLFVMISKPLKNIFLEIKNN